MNSKFMNNLKSLAIAIVAMLMVRGFQLCACGNQRWHCSRDLTRRNTYRTLLFGLERIRGGHRNSGAYPDRSDVQY